MSNVRRLNITMKSASALSEFAESRSLKFLLDPRTDGVVQEYVYSSDKKKRYAYAERWSSSGTLILWIMLNPGTGETELRRRNTLERCKAWSQQWGHGGLLIGNVYSTRTKSAKDLPKSTKDYDELNNDAIRLLASMATETVVAWGNKARKDAPAQQILPMLGEVKCLGLTARGEPRHPLYVTKNVKPFVWNPNALSAADA
jgi:hypothetical protein